MPTMITVSTSEQGAVRSESSVRRGETGDAPAQFLWEGRLHLVRAVLGHTARERVEEWRVRASAGRDATSRVFVLRFDWSDGRWSVYSEPLDAAGSPEAAVRVEVPA
ncbi:MAG TPA: hypothetical protein VGP02_12855 [Mycobacteriales bacterium]|nr:hypothetical protein [Mycobacteriales bacterium]